MFKLKVELTLIKVIRIAFHSNNCTDVTRPIYIFDVYSIELYSYHTFVFIIF